MSKFNRVGVLMGGWSGEREVSLNTGAACSAALLDNGYEVVDVDVDRDIAAKLKDLSIDACFNALHGTFGEDGCMQGILETLEIPYTHSGVMASSLAMNKDVAKRIMSAAGVGTAKSAVVRRSEIEGGHGMVPPFVIKPVADGSSVGIFLITDAAMPVPYDEIALDGAPNDMLMIETYVAGRELTCAVLDGRALDVMEIQPSDTHTFYDYDAKYAPGGSQHVVPAEISSNIYQFIQKWTLEAHNALGCRGISRADFRYDAQSDTLVCLEVNTQPGMTATSLVPELAEYSGWTFNKLVAWIMEDASCHR